MRDRLKKIWNKIKGLTDGLANPKSDSIFTRLSAARHTVGEVNKAAKAIREVSDRLELSRKKLLASL